MINIGIAIVIVREIAMVVTIGVVIVIVVVIVIRRCGILSTLGRREVGGHVASRCFSLLGVVFRTGIFSVSLLLDVQSRNASA